VVAFKYDYINPEYPGLPEIMKAFYPGPIKDIPCTGPAPILARADLFRRIVPAWERITLGIEVN
jgi:hypothetical protein